MAKYRLSVQAANDLEQIFIYGVLNFGLSQAESYAEGLQQHIVELAAHPRRYPAVDEIREGYRRSVYGSHSIYYRVEGNFSLIVRILRNQDTTAAL